MKKTAIKVLSYLLLATTGIAAGWGGSYAVQLLAQPDDMAVVEVASVQPQVSMDAVQLRVRGGQMEWFDGVRWNAAAAVDELKQSDPIETESDAWYALAQQRGTAKEEQRQEALAQFDREQTDLSVGEKPVVRQPTTTRQPSAAASTPAPNTGGGTTTPTPPPPPAQTQTPSGGGDNSGGNSDGGGEWSDDYL